MTRPNRQLWGDEGGATYVEFLIAFIPMFMLFLGMLQAALLYAGNLAVHHAANAAVRSAVVVLPDDPERYGDEPVNDITGGDGGSCRGAASSFFSILTGGSVSIGSSGSCRLQAIRWAASAKLLAVSPSLDQLIHDETVLQAVGGNPWERAATGAVLYNRGHVAVTFPERPGSNNFRERFGRDDDVTVRVTYAFHCGVPLVNRFMCDDFLSLLGGVPIELTRQAASAIGTGDPVLAVNAVQRVRTGVERIRRARPGMSELRQVEDPALGVIVSLYGARYVVLRAEATMRNQGAPYRYQ